MVNYFSGEGSAVNQVFFSSVPRELEIYKPGEIIKAKFILKYPHGTAERTGVKVYPYNGDIRICKLKLTHIGRNYPCLRDPSLGPNTGQNSSTYKITQSNNKKYHQLDFRQLKNYGRKYFIHMICKISALIILGTGYFAQDINLDADAIEFTAIYTHDNPNIQIVDTDYLTISTYPYTDYTKLSTLLDAGSSSVIRLHFNLSFILSISSFWRRHILEVLPSLKNSRAETHFW